MHLQRVFPRMGGFERADHAAVAAAGRCFGVQRDAAIRHVPGRGGVDREALEADIVRRADQHDAADPAASP